MQTILLNSNAQFSQNACLSHVTKISSMDKFELIHVLMNSFLHKDCTKYASKCDPLHLVSSFVSFGYNCRSINNLGRLHKTVGSEILYLNAELIKALDKVI